ncbi:MAG: DUF4417 domain-containing protein [Halomonas sp.]|uniref:DUF4417 domain-containing protein n=1 Tax=Halomonas sp. TaxID=1486246 RepID=UPI003970848D
MAILKHWYGKGASQQNIAGKVVCRGNGSQQCRQKSLGDEWPIDQRLANCRLPVCQSAGFLACLQPYHTKHVDDSRDLCHFYLDDYRFETTWNKLNAALIHLRRYWAVMTPDFSLYPQWPAVVNQWNTYRSRWLGRWWQRQGLRVIPTVNWSDEASHAYCFDGIPPGQIVTIGVPDARRQYVVERYRDGVDAMCERLSPRLVIVYGRSPMAIEAPSLEVVPDWYQLRGLSSRLQSGYVCR